MFNEDPREEHSNSIRRLRQQCINSGMSNEEFRGLYYESLEYVERNHRLPQNRWSSIRKYIVLFIVFLLTVCIVYNYRQVYSTCVCNFQEFVYPGLRLLRRLSIPFLAIFPSLAELYQETCLVHNPFFTVVDMDCWPCSSVSNVRQVYDPKPVNQQHGAPFFYETEQQLVNLKNIKDLYLRNREVFDKEAPKILANNLNYLEPLEMFNSQDRNKGLFIWKFNNVNVARILRQLVPRPKVVPKFGQSTERFIIIDTKQESFKVPDTECSFSFVLSLSGTRTIDLRPAEECTHQCKSLKVDLKEAYLLWYNWWYWRPVVQPSSGNTTLVAHVGSYC